MTNKEKLFYAKQILKSITNKCDKEGLRILSQDQVSAIDHGINCICFCDNLPNEDKIRTFLWRNHGRACSPTLVNCGSDISMYCCGINFSKIRLDDLADILEKKMKIERSLKFIEFIDCNIVIIEVNGKKEEFKIKNGCIWELKNGKGGLRRECIEKEKKWRLKETPYKFPEYLKSKIEYLINKNVPYVSCKYNPISAKYKCTF